MSKTTEIAARQYALGELISVLKAEDPDKPVRYGFGIPHSYRGYYEQLAFEPVADTTVGEMIAAAESAVGATYQGWKGGDYTMTEHTDVWLALQGDGNGETIGAWSLALMLGVDPE